MCRADLLPAPGTGIPRYLLEGVDWGALGGPPAFQTRPCLVCVCARRVTCTAWLCERLFTSPTRLGGCVVMCKRGPQAETMCKNIIPASPCIKTCVPSFPVIFNSLSRFFEPFKSVVPALDSWWCWRRRRWRPCAWNCRGATATRLSVTDCLMILCCATIVFGTPDHADAPTVNAAAAPALRLRHYPRRRHRHHHRCHYSCRHLHQRLLFQCFRLHEYHVLFT